MISTLTKETYFINITNNTHKIQSIKGIKLGLYLH